MSEKSCSPNARGSQEPRVGNAALELSQALFHDGPVVVFRCGTQRGLPVQHVTPNVEPLFGIGAAAFVDGRLPYASFVLDKDRERFEGEVEQLVAGKLASFDHTPYRIVDVNGTQHWLQDHKMPLCDEAGRVTGLLGYVFASDQLADSGSSLGIPEARGGGYPLTGLETQTANQGEALKTALAESERKYHSLQELTEDGVFLADADTGLIVDANRQAARLLGAGPNGVIGCHLSELSTPGGQNLYQQIITQTADTQSERGEPSVTPLEVRCSPIKTRQGHLLQGIVKDLGDREDSTENLRNHKDILSILGDQVALVDRNYRYRLVNDAFLKVYEKRREDIVGHEVAELLGREIFQDVIKDRIDRCLNGETVHYQGWFKLPSGKRRYMDVVYTPYLGYNHEIDGILANVRDITEHRQTEEELRASEERFRALFDHVRDGILLTDTSGERFIDGNQEICRMLGLDSREELLDMGLADITTPDYLPRARAQLQEVLQHESTLNRDVPVYRKDGALFYADISCGVLQLGDETFLIGVFRDVSARHRAEAELTRRADILNAVAELSQDILKADSWTASVDPALARLGQAARASRAYLFHYQEDSRNRPACEQRFAWSAENLPPDTLHPALTDLNAGYCLWHEQLARRQTVERRQRQFTEQESSLLEPFGIRAILMVPLFVKGTYWGFLGFDDCRDERTWAGTEVDALTLAAGVIGSAIEREQFGHQLAERERRYALATEAGRVGVWEWDIASGQLFSDMVLRDIVGYAQEEIGSDLDTWLQLALPEDLKKLKQVRDSLSRGEVEEVHLDAQIRDKTGANRCLAVRGILSRGDGGRPVRVCGTATDVTERRLMEDELRRANEEWANTFDTVPDCIAILDTNYRILKTNQAFDKHFGHLPQGPIHDPDHCPVCHEDLTLDDCPYKALLKDGKTHTLIVDNNRWGGQFQITASPLHKSDGTLRGAVYVVHDITDMKQAEKARLALAEQQRDVLVREVHHRIKNHLQGLMGLLSQGRKRHPDCAASISEAITQIESIAAVYGLQCRSSGASVNLMDILNAIVRNVSAFSPIQVVMFDSTELPPLRYIARDKAVAIALVINELLINALKQADTKAAECMVRVHLQSQEDRLLLTIGNPGSLPPGFDYGNGQGLGTGLGLLRDMVPREGAELSIREAQDEVKAILTLYPPLLAGK